MLRSLLAVPITTALLAFSSATQAQIWQWDFMDANLGVGYMLTFDSLSADGKVGTYTLTVDTSGYDKHADPSYLDSVDIKAWGGKDISFSLLSAPSGSAWSPTEGPTTANGCKGGESGFACVEAVTKIRSVLKSLPTISIRRTRAPMSERGTRTPAEQAKATASLQW
jgi:hypothetical protein